ncbi:MAG TPA: MauE/DoxX family redox-associated membrane protein [Gelidibacter sp.]|uniref:MauE/DoxX family redox-associated membrane protein n=1 Tax=Gelidibacter sp. TaxID=2018083 RepID=UPI002B84B64F|nr:MauE/DoxX family redox-associated membrane protein [Gelidibacter sp.]HXJ99557.1 MauE/DoxX family redox-associated membrane protein [Gelidibacter sp.]
MKVSKSIKNNLITVICYLYVLLFVYTAVSKALDFEKFQVQLGQSPLLSAFADWVSWGVILSELFVAGLLLFDKTRRIGLYISLALMTMFTTYIVIILNFSSFVPCSCGGVLEKMGWTEHLIFNICFIILALIALILEKKQTDTQKLSLLRPKSFIISILTIFFGGIMFVIGLYLLSEEEIHRNNSFLRRYPPHPVTIIKGLNIKYNSYYIAGVAEDRIYLGNTSAPAHILSVDTTITNVKTHQIELDNEQKITFFSPQIRIRSPYFFLIDGNVPVIFKGKLSDWKAQFYWQGDNNGTFSQIEAVSLTQFVFRGLDKNNNQNVIGRIDFGNPQTLKISDELLQKQIDGIFDTDGMLRYNSELNSLVYVYYYRNEFLTADTELKLDYNGRTIDTVKNAVIKIASTNSGQVRTLAEQPLLVNHQSYSSGKYLFIKSGRLGKYEPEEMLKDASIIDVYNLENRTYEFSFYLYDYEGEKIKSFQIYRNLLIGLSEHYIVLYRLNTLNFDLKF